MAELLLISCVLAIGVAGGIVALLFAPARRTPLAQPLPRASLASMERWRPAPAPHVVTPIAENVAPPAPVVAPPVPVLAPPVPIVTPQPSPPTPRFMPVVRDHAPLPPLSRVRAARGTDAPRRDEPTEKVPVRHDFAVDLEPAVDDPTLAR